MTVLVVGGGLAGATAALRLAEAGAAVELVSAGPGASAMIGGALDAASASPGVAALPWRDPLRGHPLGSRERLAWLLREAPSHPYAAVFPDAARAAAALDEAYAAARRWLAPHGYGLVSPEGGGLFATSAGTVRPADHVTGALAAGELRGRAEIRVASAPGLEGWEPALLARNLGHELDAVGVGAPPVVVVHPRWPEGLLGGGPGARLAARLDEPGGAGLLAEAVAGLGADDALLLLPPAIGLARTEELLAAAARAAGGPVAEAMSFPPHGVAGHRLMRALEAALAAASVPVTRGRVTRLACEADGVTVALPGATRKVDGVVLACGRFVGGGLQAGARAVREPLLDLPIFDDDGRRVDGIPAHRSVRKGYASTQPLYAAGIRVDRELRPLDVAGRPAWPRVLAAGDLLGGFDPGRQRTGAGVALATGWAAAGALLGARGEGAA